MDIMMFALWGAVGWCGTPYPGWWRGPRPHPDPEPWWLIAKIIGVIAGVVGGWAYTQLFAGLPPPVPWRSPLGAATSSLGAFVVARIVGDIYHAVAGAKKTAAG